MSERASFGVQEKDVKRDDLMAFIYYARVTHKKRGELAVEDVDNANSFFVRGKQLIENGLSADRFYEEKRSTKTKVAELLSTSFNRPLTVCFTKQNGEERVLRGRLKKPEPFLGRSQVEDLDLNDANRQRLVDHRTIKWLVVDGVKYVVR
jgi:hypothetical protein